MIPAVSSVGATSVQPVGPGNAARSSLSLNASSTGEPGASNVRLATSVAVTAPEQTAVAPRLRDQETTERTERSTPPTDAPTGPPPAFDESPLERQARVVFDPPDMIVAQQDEPEQSGQGFGPESEQPDPPPAPRDRAEIGFAEARSLSNRADNGTVNIAM